MMMRIVPIFLLLFTPALAHDPSRPELNEWFNRLASGKGLRCSFADGFVVGDVDWESKDGHYRVQLEGRWIDVPDDAVITEPNRAGRTMVWPYTDDRGTDRPHTEIRCTSCRAAWARGEGSGPRPGRRASFVLRKIQH